MTKSGAMISTGGLAPTSMGARLRLSGGMVTVTDGPFTESKEIIGGYAIVEAKSKEEAIESLAEAIKLILQDRREDGLRGIPPNAVRDKVTVK